MDILKNSVYTQNNNYNNIEKLVETVKGSNTILISGHQGPDGDSIGACFALFHALKKIDKNPIVLVEKYSAKFDFIPKPESESLVFEYSDTLKNADIYISLDCSDTERLGEFKPLFESAAITANIDHHITNDNFADINIVDMHISSASELIYGVISSFTKIDEKIAICLYEGIVYDTGGFRHSSTTAQTHKIVSELLKIGIDSDLVQQKLFSSLTFKELKLIGLAISKCKEQLDGRLIHSYISEKELSEYNATSKNLDSVITFLNSVDNAKVSMFVYEKGKNEVKISLRSNGEFNVAEFSQKRGGGGHARAAGYNVYGEIEQVYEKAVSEIMKELNAVL